MDFAIPPEIKAYLAELDAFIAREIDVAWDALDAGGWLREDPAAA